MMAVLSPFLPVDPRPKNAFLSALRLYPENTHVETLYSQPPSLKPVKNQIQS